MTDPGGVARVDVFSVKGGVGKTTVSVLLARAQAEHTKQPVLLIDADLTGTCLGHLLGPAITGDWNETHNLAHLVCDPPETLDEALTKDRLPVYRDAGADAKPKEHHVSKLSSFQSTVLYCPSHGGSSKPAVDAQVLQALIGHETAGGWVSLVIERVIEATQQITGPLGGVIVDHSPGMAALQSLAFEQIGRAGGRRRALFVTTTDRVDLKMTNVALGHQALEHATVVFNRTGNGWKSEPQVAEFVGKGWFTAGHSLQYSEKLRLAYAQSQRFVSEDSAELERLRAAVFRG